MSQPKSVAVTIPVVRNTPTAANDRLEKRAPQAPWPLVQPFPRCQNPSSHPRTATERSPGVKASGSAGASAKPASTAPPQKPCASPSQVPAQRPPTIPLMPATRPLKASMYRQANQCAAQQGDDKGALFIHRFRAATSRPMVAPPALDRAPGPPSPKQTRQTSPQARRDLRRKCRSDRGPPR